MCANHCDFYGAASGKNRGPLFYIRNALYSVRLLVYIQRAHYLVRHILYLRRSSYSGSPVFRSRHVHSSGGPPFRFRRVRFSGGPLINLRRPLFVVLAGLTASLWITLLLTPWGPVDYEPYRNRRVCLTGTVAGLEPALENDEVIWRLTLADVNLESSGAAGSGSGTIPLERRARVQCLLDCRPDLDMSARVRVRGSLFPFRFARNEGEFDSRLYYHILRTAFSLRDVRIEAFSGPTDHLAASLYRLKRLLAGVIDLVFPDRTAPVLQAILLGEKGLLGSETKDLYQGAGIIHILSISGVDANTTVICPKA